MSRSGRQLNIRLSEDLYEQLQALSVAEERSMAQTIRYALRRYVSAPTTVGVATFDFSKKRFDNESGVS